MRNFNIKKNVFILLALAVFSFTGCQKASETGSNNSVNSARQTPAPPQDVKVEIKTNPLFVEAGKDVSLNLILTNEKDEPIRDLKITHEKPMHLLIVSQDLGEFYHLHPEADGGDGSYIVRHTFPGGGRYTMFLDLTLPDGKQIVKTIGMAVIGKERPKTELKADTNFVKTIDGLKVEMKPDAELAGGKSANLNFTLTDPATNKPPTDMEKYLGEDAHFVIVSQDVKEFVHAHPLSDAPDAEPSHIHHTPEPAQAGKEISTHVTFPKGGLYKIWAQFQRAGKVITVPFVVQVKAAEGEMDISKVEIPKGAIKVTVSKDGYNPKAIEVKAGQTVTLAFIRIDNENCGQELVFPALNIKKELPLGKVVTVDIPTEKTGEFNFACGMDMLKGIVMVE